MSRIRVMHVIDTLHGGGAETSILETVPALEDRGIETFIVTLLQDDAALEGRINTLGIRRIRLRRTEPISRALELRQVIRAERPDVIHTSLMYANLTGRIAAFGTATPVITSLVNSDYGSEHRSASSYGSWSVRAAQAADLITAPLTTRFHAISNHVAEVMSRRLKIPRERIEVVYRGRDSARLGEFTADRRLKVRSSLSIPTDVPLVLCVGRVDRQKGLDIAINAFRLVQAQIPEAVLLVAGRPGNASTLVEGMAQSTPNARLLGHRTDIPDLMCAADVLAFPSRWEGLGGTLVEAMALRLGIVASDIAPVAEVIGDVGWPLAAPDDAPALAEGLLSVLKAGDVNEGKKIAGEQRFRKLFTADAAAEGMAGLYRHVRDGVKRGRPATVASERGSSQLQD